jgi:hypothetical protein
VEERLMPDEAHSSRSSTATTQMKLLEAWWFSGGNTKTHGMCAASSAPRPAGAPAPRRSCRATPVSAWGLVRPHVTSDIEMFVQSMASLMGVPGPKLMDEERYTQDFFGVSPPTFVTPDTKANAHLQKYSVQNAQLFHFVNFRRPHLLDLIMQSLWIKTQSSPLEAPYFSCVPYLMGDGQALRIRSG